MASLPRGGSVTAGRPCLVSWDNGMKTMTAGKAFQAAWCRGAEIFGLTKEWPGCQSARAARAARQGQCLMSSSQDICLLQLTLHTLRAQTLIFKITVGVSSRVSHKTIKTEITTRPYDFRTFDIFDQAFLSIDYKYKKIVLLERPFSLNRPIGPIQS